MTEGPRILACQRVADLPDPQLLSHRARCKRCDAQVWVARSSPAADLIFCMQCALDEMKLQAETGEEIEVKPPTAKQRNDLARWRRRRKQ